MGQSRNENILENMLGASNVSPLVSDTISNMFLSVTSYSNYGIRVSAQGERYYFCHITDNIQGITDVNSWKSWLANNNVQVCSKLATPVIIDLPDGEPIITLIGTNNIFADTGDTSLQFRKIG